MSRKTNKITQVRLSAESSKEIDLLRAECEVQASRNSFASMLLWRGIQDYKRNRPNHTTQPDSTFKK